MASSAAKLPSKSDLMEMSAGDLKNEAKAAGVGPKADSNTKEENAAAIISAKTAAVSEAQIDGVADSTGNALREQEKVQVRLYQVPAGSTDSPLPDEVVVINGYAYQIQRGVDVEVPAQVKQVLIESGRI